MEPEVISRVAKIPLFAGLTKAAIAALLGNAVVAIAPAGTVLFAQGDVADRFYVQLDGQIELYVVAPDGRESVIDILGAGETFAEEAIFERGLRLVSDGKGYGLGLGIARRIVQQHGGRLTARNSKSGGAVLEFRLPLGG